MRPFVPNFELRRRARQAVFPLLSLMAVIGLIATLPDLLYTAVTLMTGSNPAVLMDSLTEQMEALRSSGLTGDALSAAANQVMLDFSNQCTAFLDAKGSILFPLLAAVMVLGPVLALPMRYALLLALRQEEFTLGTAMTRCRWGLRALGVSLLTALKALLWTLPGYAVMIVALFLPGGLAMLLMLAGMVAAIVMGVQASYRYAMSVYVLADQPGTRALACIRRSCEIMHTRKMELFGLQLSYIGWSLLLSLVQALLTVILGQVIGLTLGMLLNLILQLYMHGGEAAFYEAYAHPAEA